MKWISARALEEWSATHDSEDNLSEVAFSLIRATAPDAQDYRFPKGDSSRVAGFDGTVIATKGSTFVPAGTSVWEFGTDEAYSQKASGDLKKRSANPGGMNPADTTFVFCTSRTWAKKQLTLNKWVEKAKKDYPMWKDIRVIDGVKLEHWLESAPAVAAVEAFKRNWRPANNALSIDEFWEEYRANFRPSISENVALAGREEDAKGLIERLQGPSDRILLRYDSSDEVIAFIAAAIRNAPDAEAKKFLAARTLVISSEEAGRFFRNQRELIFVLRGDARRTCNFLTGTNLVLAPLTNDYKDDRPEVRRLTRPTEHQFSEALKTIMPEVEARTMGLVALGSLTVLMRHRPNLSKARPAWEGKLELLAATLAGAWDVRKDEDKERVRELAGLATYEEYEAQLQPYLEIEDPPIERLGTVWRMLAPFDALLANWSYLTPAHRDRLRQVALTVFAERDKTLGGEEDFENRKFKHSDWIRDGLANTMLHLAVLRESQLPGSSWVPDQFVDELIGGIPGLDSDPDLLMSLKDVCPLLMEASPRPFLKALERLLEGNGDKAAALFRGREGWDLSDSHTGLLWGLETLAWDPALLEQVVLTLGGLARVDPGGNVSNRPIESLAEIFLPWKPNTNAVGAAREAILDSLIKAEPDVGWDLVKRLLPGKKTFSSPTHKPGFRESGASEAEKPTRATYQRDEQVILDRAFKLVGANADRWTDFYMALPAASEEFRERSWASLREATARMSTDDRRKLWDFLRNRMALEKKYPNTSIKFSRADNNAVSAIIAELEPKGGVEKARYLFDDYVPGLSDDDAADTANDPLVAARKAAVERVLEAGGVPGLLELISSVKLPHFVAVGVVDASPDVDAAIKTFEQLFPNNSISKEFFASWSSHALTRYGERWTQFVLNLLRDETVDAERRASLVSFWKPTNELWDDIEKIGATIDRAYWTLLPPWTAVVPKPLLERMSIKMAAVGRAAAAITMLREDAKLIKPEVVFELLDKAVAEINASKDRVGNMFTYAVEKVFQALADQPDVDRGTIGAMEYRYLPLFGYARRTDFVLGDLLASNPEFYTSVLFDIFKKRSEPAREPTERERNRASLAYRLLSSFDKLPGTHTSGQVDEVALNAWVDAVRDICAKEDREGVGDTYVGHALAHAPDDPADGAWPHAAIRRTVERLKNETVENGINIERHNMRGVVMKDLYEGGGQERRIAETIREWAKKCAGYPRTSAMLKRLAESYESDAKGEDLRAEQDRRRI